MGEEQVSEREKALAAAASEGRVRLIFAAIGAAISVGVLLVYYLPGLRESNDGDDIFFLMVVPAAVLMLPWALLALLLRVKTVWIICGLLMIYLIADTSIDLNDGSGDDISIFAFFFTFIVNLFLVGIAMVIDLVIRGARRATNA